MEASDLAFGLSLTISAVDDEEDDGAEGVRDVTAMARRRGFTSLLKKRTG